MLGVLFRLLGPPDWCCSCVGVADEDVGVDDCGGFGVHMEESLLSELLSAEEILLLSADSCCWLSLNILLLLVGWLLKTFSALSGVSTLASADAGVGLLSKKLVILCWACS